MTDNLVHNLDLWIHSANQLACITSPDRIPLRGNDMHSLLVIPNGSIGVQAGKIVTVTDRPTPDAPWLITADTRIINASGRLVTPGLIDCHTHTVFGGSRENEFSLKIQGTPYMDIARSGGGIRRTVRQTRSASFEELVTIGQRRLHEALRLGITTIEIKSGYGLSYDAELKLLEVIKALQTKAPQRIIPTLLAAHEIPEDLTKTAYLDIVRNQIIPTVATRKLAKFCDVFCEQGVYSLEEALTVLETAKQYGLKPKLHADQLRDLGGAVLAGNVTAVSADHLDFITTQGIHSLAEHGVIPVLLPGCNFFMGLKHYPPARTLINANLPIALATDFNPGSCMTQNLVLIMTIACTQLRMTPNETLAAVTINAAAAVGLEQEIGLLAPGYAADLVIWQVPTIDYLPYHFGQNHAAIVIVNGVPVINND